MSAFFDRFDELCRARGETPNSVARKLGIPSGSVTAWKKGAEPRNKTVWKLVDFFGVDFNYMLGRTDEPTSFRLENGKFIITRPNNSPRLSEEEVLAGEEHELEEIQKILNARTKKAPTEEGERDFAQNEHEEDMLLLARHMEPIPEEDRNQLKDQFRKSIDLYLKAKGISTTEEK